MEGVGFIVGALVPTILLSRLGMWMLKGWDGGNRKIVVAHLISLLICSLIGGMGMADGGAFAGIQALMVYLIPQAFWAVAEMYRERQKATSASFRDTDESNGL